jgi:hypothetical protein
MKSAKVSLKSIEVPAQNRVQQTVPVQERERVQFQVSPEETDSKLQFENSSSDSYS